MELYVTPGSLIALLAGELQFFGEIVACCIRKHIAFFRELFEYALQGFRPARLLTPYRGVS